MQETAQPRAPFRGPRESPGDVFVAGHFGEWVQGRLGPAGPLGLVTLACPDFGVRVTYAQTGDFKLDECPDVLGIARARAFLTSLGKPLTGALTLTADLPPGSGGGVSTAALVALARAVGASDNDLPAACLKSEGASDPLMLRSPDEVLWAPRQAQIVEEMPAPPYAEIIGGFWGQPEQTDPRDTRFPDISDLVAAWRQTPNLREAAKLATASALRTTKLRGPHPDPTARLGRALGALGHARAHTGSARALIFPPGRAPSHAKDTLLAEGYHGIVQFRTGRRR